MSSCNIAGSLNPHTFHGLLMSAHNHQDGNFSNQGYLKQEMVNNIFTEHDLHNREPVVQEQQVQDVQASFIADRIDATPQEPSFPGETRPFEDPMISGLPEPSREEQDSLFDPVGRGSNEPLTQNDQLR
jgi:hypothetical protein